MSLTDGSLGSRVVSVDEVSKRTTPGGSIVYYKNNKRHREDGPAVIHPEGYEAWYREGKLHREDGPAKIFRNGVRSWWLFGKQVKPFTPEQLELRLLEAIDL